MSKYHQKASYLYLFISDMLFRDERKEVSLTKFPMKYDPIDRQRDGLIRSQSQIQSSSPRLFQKKKQVLPPISSPFLKKTIHHLFHNKNPLKVLDLQQKMQKNEESFENPKQFQMSKGNNFLDKRDDVGLKKIAKSFSTIKHTKYNYLQQMKNSVALKSNAKQRKERRNTTQGSQKGRSQSKRVTKKILKIRQQPEQDIAPQKVDQLKVKEVKPVNFVIKQKINHELYVHEKEQIKMIKTLMKKGKEQNLGNFIKVKNYSKFMPGVISIQN